MAKINANNSLKSEQWFIINKTNSPITIGDLPALPAIPANNGVQDLLLYHDKSDISISAGLKVLLNSGKLEINKTINNSGDASSAIASAEESDTAAGNPGGATEVGFTPDGDISSTTVQAAITEVRDDTDAKISNLSSTDLQDTNSIIRKVDVVDNLTTTSVDIPLSANQGKVLQDQLFGIGDVKVVADVTARDALTDISVGDVIHVEDRGDGKWERYQISTTTDGTWANSTSTTIADEDAASLTGTDLSYTSGNRMINSSTGSSVQLPFADGGNDGLMSSGNWVKLANIEANATADQTDAEIKTAYENNADTNVFTDAEKTKLGNTIIDNGINLVEDNFTITFQGDGGNAGVSFDESTDRLLIGGSGLIEVELFAPTVDVSGDIVIAGLVDGRDVAADGTKLDGIESNATADQTDAEIKTAYENNANTNAFTDVEKDYINSTSIVYGTFGDSGFNIYDWSSTGIVDQTSTANILRLGIPGQVTNPPKILFELDSIGDTSDLTITLTSGTWFGTITTGSGTSHLTWMGYANYTGLLESIEITINTAGTHDTKFKLTFIR